MKKLHSLAFYALLTPAITLSSGALLAAQGSSEDTDLGEQSMGQDADPKTQSPQQDKTVTKSKYNTDEPADQEMGNQSGMQSKGYMESPPANGMMASDLIGTEVKTSGDESVGEIGDLIIDQDGKAPPSNTEGGMNRRRGAPKFPEFHFPRAPRLQEQH